MYVRTTYTAAFGVYSRLNYRFNQIITMCDNVLSVIRKFNIDDTMNLGKAGETLTAEEYENFSPQIPRKYFLHGSRYRFKSKSDSDLYHLPGDYKNSSRYTDFDVSSFPSDSDVTVIRVLKRSKAQEIPSNTIEGILGDGSHLPESSSMVNLATLVQGISISSREKQLIPVSSWDSPIDRSASDTTVQSPMHVAAYSWVDGAFSQLQQASSSTFVNDRFFPKNVVAGLSELLIINNKSLQINCNNQREIRSGNLNGDLIIIGDNKLANDDIIIHNADIDDKIKFGKDKSMTNDCKTEKLFARFSARIQKTFRRTVQCSCFPAFRRNKQKFNSHDQDL